MVGNFLAGGGWWKLGWTLGGVDLGEGGKGGKRFPIKKGSLMEGYPISLGNPFPGLGEVWEISNFNVGKFWFGTFKKNHFHRNISVLKTILVRGD